MPDRIVVVGVQETGLEEMSKQARIALAEADLVVGGRRHLDALAPLGAPTVAIAGDIDSVLDSVAAADGCVCVLASGDPGFFGIVRPLSARFGPSILEVHPAPSSVAIAFARLGLPWDDATVVSAHGRPLVDAVRAIATNRKIAVLVSPESSPSALGSALLQAGARHDRVAVCSRLGLPGESIDETDLEGLASGEWDPLSVVVLLAGDPLAARPTLQWGIPDEEFDHRDGMVTTAEVRAIVLGKLALPAEGVMWDVGAGSGSVAVEAGRLAPALEVIAIERRADDAARIRNNARSHGSTVRVVEDAAPQALASLPDPDRAFVGGGGIAVLDAVLARLRPNGRIVATFAAMDRAVEAADRLGHLVQVGLGRGERLPDGGLRLAAVNPVFVVWGTSNREPCR